MANMPKADSRPARVDSAEPMSEVVTELLAAFGDPDPNLNQIVELIDLEPALSAEIMRRSNSVVYGGRAPATDVFEAISRIGIQEAYRALVTFSDPHPIAPQYHRVSIWR